MRPPVLSDIELRRELSTLHGWAHRRETLTKTFVFADFPAGIQWIAGVANVAEIMQHHPDLDIRYTKITATLSTHDVGGITALDVTLAREMETLAG